MQHIVPYLSLSDPPTKLSREDGEAIDQKELIGDYQLHDRESYPVTLICIIKKNEGKW